MLSLPPFIYYILKVFPGGNLKWIREGFPMCCRRISMKEFHLETNIKISLATNFIVRLWTKLLVMLSVPSQLCWYKQMKWAKDGMHVDQHKIVKTQNVWYASYVLLCRFFICICLFCNSILCFLTMDFVGDNAMW